MKVNQTIILYMLHIALNYITIISAQ